MINCMIDEIEIRLPHLNNQIIETIYFGGGTPSLLSAVELSAILAKIRSHYLIDSEVEITMEANPDDISKEILLEWKEAGINRLSIGLQSFREEDLKWMNRAHSKTDALNCVVLAKEAGFNNISIDLIYGLPNFTLDDWKANIEIALSFGIQHVSAYCLTVEDKTVLSKWVAQKIIKPANEDDQSDQFETLLTDLEEFGMEQYEISNFAIPGYHSRHNSNYWKGKHYIGIGPSAHSFNGVSRSWNISNNREYMKSVQTGSHWFETEQLTVKDQFNELLLIGLRTSIGVNMDQLNAIQNPSELFWKKIEKMKQSGWLFTTDQAIVLTKSGKLKADLIASELFLD